MATDTTELTFIRCPECRSLVPAMSSRCRMCGAGLNKDAKSEEQTPPAPTSRVRQQTVSTSSSSELTQQLSELRQQADEQTDSLSDPLEEFLANETEEKTETGSAVETSIDDSNDDIDDFEDDDHDDEISELDDEQEEQSFSESEDIQDDEDDFENDLEDLDDLYDELDDLDDLEDIDAQEETLQAAEDQESIDTTTLSAAQEKVEEQKPKTRVVVEQGRGKFSKGLSFGGAKPRFDTKSADVKPTVTEVKAPQEVVPSVIKEEVLVEQKVFNEEVLTQEPPMQPKYKVDHEENYSKPTEVKESPERATGKGPVGVAAVSTKDSVKKGEQLGRIFGWLVSYTNPSGNSIELREGRFFVSSSQLRSTDLVLEDETVSTPHAMFTIGTEGGIVIQDLKSERGVFVREQDQSTYHREYDSVTLNHGDWVRFGDLEFLVSIIAHVGAK